MARDTFLSWPFFDDAHRALRSDLERFVTELEGIINSSAEDGDERASCRRLVKALGASGWLRHAVAELEVRSLCLIRETLAYHHGLADFAFAMQGLGSAPISLFGSDELKSKYLPATAAGDAIAAFALSEPDAGSDVAAIATTAATDGDDYVLNGTKTWISNGGIADYYVVFARTENEPTTKATKALSAIVVDKDATGFAVDEEIEVVAPHPLAKLSFRDCRVPRTQLVGKAGKGLKVALGTLDVFRASVGAAALGFARRALDEALARVQSREQFGQKLAEFQLTQARLADMATAIDASALLVYRSAWTKDAGAERVTKESSMAKMYATEAAQKVVDDAVQLFGAAGVVKGSVVERLYREVRALRIYEGTTEIHKLIIAKQVLADA
ncbi:MAG: acyl-CoA dehydrogenase family protein [Acidobacteriota bacterium]|nr:MAG: acyl-CoA dehydrogenase family protein [Acidobacteriota bacterium]